MSLLPKILRDSSNLTLEKCVYKAFDIDLKPFMIYLLDNVDIRILKYLAYQFHILGDEGWNLCETEKEQRDLLKIAFQIHKFKGTKKALIRILNILGLKSAVQEWFEYSGRIHRFKIIITVTTESHSPELYNKLKKYINIFKNKRSRCELLEVRLLSQGYSYIFPRVISEEVLTAPKMITI